MKTIPSNLSPRGWALLVLAGGSTLAIPFFKGSSSDGKYSTISTSPANKPEEKTPSFNLSANAAIASSPQTKPLTSSQSQPQASLPSVAKVDSPSLNKPITQVLESSREHSNTASTKPSLINQPERRTTTQASAAVGPPSGLDDTRNAKLEMSSPKKAGQVEELPKPTVGNRADTNVVVSQPRRKEQPTATPVPTEFPSWAKKPSLLDSLLNGKPASTEQDTLDARKPTSFQTWADNNTQGVPAIAPVDSDRYTPFGQVDQNISLTTTDSTAEVRWPDEDPRTAVAIVKPPKLVGRDAMIRDPEKLQSPSSTRSPAILSATVSSATALPGPGSGSTSPGKEFGKEFGKAPATINQPRFGEQPKTVEKPRASLRSQLPPDEQQIIRQPSLKGDR